MRAFAGLAVYTNRLHASSLTPDGGVPKFVLRTELPPMAIRQLVITLFAFLWTTVSAAAQTIAVNGEAPPNGVSVVAATTVSLSISGGPGNPADWVALYPVGAADGDYLRWYYLSGTDWPPETGVTSATFPTYAPLVAGEYEWRMFADNGWTRIATSSLVTVTTSPAVLRVNGEVPPTPITLVAGSQGVVTLESGTGHGGDSIALYRVGEPDTLVDWRYFNDTGVPPGVTTATLYYTVPSTVGTYEFRFLAEGGGVLTKTTVTVAQSTATMSVNSVTPPASVTVAPGGTLTLQVAGGPANALDWVGLAVQGAPDAEYSDWQYLNGSGDSPGVTSATLSFTAPSTLGTYELRLFANNGYERLATSSPIVVGSTESPSVTVAMTSPFHGTTFNAPSSVLLAAAASATGGTIGRVDFFMGSMLIGSASTEPYGTTWVSPPEGVHVLTAVAVDGTSTSTTSAPVIITIAQAGADEGTLGAPVASPGGGLFSEPPVVTVAADPTADIRYTLNGAEPTESSAQYTAPIAIPSNGATLKARAFKVGWTASETMSLVYQRDTTAPYLSITSPSPRVLVSSGALTVTGTIIESFSTATVACEGTAALVANNAFSCEVEIPSGTSIVNIVAIDAAGNARTVLLEVTTSDQIGPEPTALRMTPQNVTLGVGETRRFRATDDLGRVPADAAWTIDNETLATLVAAADVAGIELTAVAPGDVTITATWHGQSATSVVSIVTTLVAGTTLWSNPPLLGGDAVADVVRGASAPSGTRLLYAVEGEGESSVLRAFSPDGQEIWTQNLGGGVYQMSGDSLGGAVVLLSKAGPEETEVRELHTFTPDGRGAFVTTADSPGFAIHPDGPLYIVVGQQLKGIDIGLGQGRTVALTTGTGEVTLAGVPTVLDDGSVTLPMTVYGGANSPGESLDLLWLRPNGTVDVFPVDGDPTGFFLNFSPRPHKAIPNGLGGVLVAYDLHYYFAFPNDVASVRLVNADGSLGAGISWGGTSTFGSWLSGTNRAGRFVLGEGRIIATGYRFGSQGAHVRISGISLEGYTEGDGYLPGTQAPRFTAVEGGQFFESYPDGSTFGPDPEHEAVQLANAIEAGPGKFLGTAEGALTMRVAGPLALASSWWPFSFGSEQAQNAPRQLCNLCFKDYVPPEGHGPVSGLDNRRIITVVIDQSWHITPGVRHPRIQAAMVCAMNKWNDIKDAWGNKTGFYFVSDHIGIYGTPDITIVKGMSTHESIPPGTWAAIDPGGPDFSDPSTVFLIPANVDAPDVLDNDLCSRVQHEFGHKLGGFGEGSCKQWTIFSGSNPSGSRQIKSVTALDVEIVNQAFVYPHTCTGIPGSPLQTEQIRK